MASNESTLLSSYDMRCEFVGADKGLLPLYSGSVVPLRRRQVTAESPDSRTSWPSSLMDKEVIPGAPKSIEDVDRMQVSLTPWSQ